MWRRSSPEAPTFDEAFMVGVGASLEIPILPGFVLDIGALFDR